MTGKGGISAPVLESAATNIETALNLVHNHPNNLGTDLFWRAYHARDPADAGTVEQSARGFLQSLGGEVAGVFARTERLGICGVGDWAIPYRDIDSELRPGPPDDNPTASRVVQSQPHLPFC
jgi:hypothetical protein